MIEQYKMEMKSLNNRERTIRVYTPNDYKTSNKKYPVIYMHDGQNLFEDQTASYGKSWNIPFQFQQEKIDAIVVGIDSGEDLGRLDELAPRVNHWAHLALPFVTRPCGGELDMYLQFIMKELIPWVNSHYQVLPDETYIAGSSMGGLASLYAILKYPTIFKGTMCLSSAFWFDEAILLDLINAVDDFKEMRIYLDFGLKELEDKAEIDYLINYHKVIVHKLNQKNAFVNFIIDEEGNHNEASWEKRFPTALKWMFRRDECVN